MAHASTAISKSKSKSAGHAAVDGNRHYGMTGMGPGTMRHFIDVQEKMLRYIGEHPSWDEEANVEQQLPPPPLPRHHRPRVQYHQEHYLQRTPNIYLDGAKESKVHTKIPTSKPVVKHTTHSGSTKKEPTRR